MLALATLLAHLVPAGGLSENSQGEQLKAAPAQSEGEDPRRTPVVEVIERVKPAVVSISTNVQRQATDFFSGRSLVFDTPGASGTGVMIYPDGFLITNDHVVAGAAARSTASRNCGSGSAPSNCTRSLITILGTACTR